MTEQGKTYCAYIEFELKAERDRRTMFDARGQILVTTAGTLVTVMAGVAAFVRTGAGFGLPRPALGALAVALFGLGSAAACGIVAGWNYLYAAATPKTLDRMISDRWGDDEIDARNHVATAQIWTIETLRRGNNRKANWIAAGQVALLGGLGALAAVVYLTLDAY